jgi:hypothetical protein
MSDQDRVALDLHRALDALMRTEQNLAYEREVNQGHAADRANMLVAIQAEQRANARAEQAEQERDEARKFGEEAARRYNDLLVQFQIVTCAFCEQEYPQGTPRHGDGALAAHIKTCPEHPLRQAEEAALAEAQADNLVLREIHQAQLEMLTEAEVSLADVHDALVVIEQDARRGDLIGDPLVTLARIQELASVELARLDRPAQEGA